MPIYCKKKKDEYLFQNQESFEAESGYTKHRGPNVYQIYANDDPRMTFDFFYGKVKFASLNLCMGKLLKNHFLRMNQRLMFETYITI